MYIFLKKNQDKIILWLFLSFLAGIFFIGTSSYNFYTQKDDFIKFGSPDETANYVFAKLLGQTGEMTIPEKYNIAVNNIIHPRSMVGDYGRIRPVSFLGIILIYGQIVKLTSYHILPYLTPFLAAIGLIYYYLFVKLLFGRSAALMSVVILAFFPVYIYYSAHSMFHNVPFVVLLLIGLYYSLLMTGEKRKNNNSTEGVVAECGDTDIPKSKYRAARITAYFFKIIRDFLIARFSAYLEQTPAQRYLSWLYAALAGYFIGLAIITRASELIWIIPLMFILWISNWKRIGVLKLLIFLLALYAALLPMFYWNEYLYGSAFRGGYAEMNRSLESITAVGEALVRGAAAGKFQLISDYLGQIKDNFFFFGFLPRQSLEMFYHYFVKMFPALFYFSFFGILLFIRRIIFFRERKYFLYFAGLAVITAILVLYYGSWKFNDNPDPDSFTIGNSYTRYWLPIYMGLIPLAAFFIDKIAYIFLAAENQAEDSKKRKNFFSFHINRRLYLFSFRFVVLLFIAVWSLNYTIAGTEEGLLITAHKQSNDRDEFNQVLAATESNSIIITFYHDKLFFPERKVLIGLFDDQNLIGLYHFLAGSMPVYYYNFTLPPHDLAYLNSRRLAEAGLSIRKIKQISHNFTLYKLDLVKNDTVLEQGDIK